MSDEFRGVIAACRGEGAGHDPEWVWTIDLGDPSVYGGVLEFIAKHIGCGEFVARSHAGPFEDFETSAKSLTGG